MGTEQRSGQQPTAPAAGGRGRLSWRERLSLSSLDSRHQIGVTVALVTVIPLLAVAALAFDAVRHAGRLEPFALVVALAALVSSGLGFIIIGRYLFNLSRLRRYLEALVAGQFDTDLGLLQGMSDIPAIERALEVLVRQLTRRAEDVEAEMRRVDDVLADRPATLADGDAAEERSLHFGPGSGNPGPMRTQLGEARLQSSLTDMLELLRCAVAVYERDGTLALGIAASPWSRALCANGPTLFERPANAVSAETGERSRGLQELALAAIAGGDVREGRLADGTTGVATPMRAHGEFAGALVFTHGPSPRGTGELNAVAACYGIAAERLRAAVPQDPLPPLIISLGKSRAQTIARLIGESIERAHAESELRRHQDSLAETIQARTAELEAMNRKLEDEVDERRRAEELKDEFVSTVSHELRTPLAITKEGIALLLDGIPGPVNEKQQRVLTSARGNIDRLARIINDLLDISKIEAGKMEMNKDRIDLIGIAGNAVRTLEPLARQKGLRLEGEWNVAHAEVYADADRIVQVLTNLLSNALKFTREGGVRVIVQAVADGFECAVVDSGVGLSEQEVARVFDKFTQFGRTEGAGEKGTGLGLAIAKQIIELHRGRIRVESTPGRGSRFAFVLPRYSANDIIHEAVENMIADVRVSKESFTLLLFDLVPATGDRGVSDKFAAGFRRLLDTHDLMRSSDYMLPRGDRQIVMLAKVTPSQLAGLYRRLIAQIGQSFNAVAPGLDVRLACGYAEFPSDGSTPGELLEKADSTLSEIAATTPGTPPQTIDGK